MYLLLDLRSSEAEAFCFSFHCPMRRMSDICDSSTRGSLSVARFIHFVQYHISQSVSAKVGAHLGRFLGAAISESVSS